MGVDDATALILDVATGNAIVVGSSSVNLVRLPSAKNSTSHICEMNKPLTYMNVECLQLRHGDTYVFQHKKNEEKVWRDRSIKLHVVEGNLRSDVRDYREMEKREKKKRGGDAVDQVDEHSSGVTEKE